MSRRPEMVWLPAAVRRGGLGIAVWMDWQRGGWQAAGVVVVIRGVDVGERRRRCRGLCS